MTVSQYLRSTVASFLRPWILKKDLVDVLMLYVGLSQIVVTLKHLELDCDFINTSLLSNSPLLLHDARLDHAKLTISFFRSPGVSLIVQGLHFVFQIRPSDDKFWVDKKKRRANILKKDAIASLDPLGASVHSALESHAGETATGRKFKALIANILLQALQLELHNSSAKLYSNGPDCCSSLYTLALKSWEVPEGHSLAWAFARSLKYVSQKKFYSFGKVSSIEELGLWLSMSKDMLVQLNPEISGDAFEGMESIVPSGARDLLMWKNVTLSLEFQQNGEFHGMDAFFPETIIQFGLAEAEAIVITVHEFQGGPKTDHPQQNQRVYSRAKHHWQRIFEKVSHSSRTKLKNVIVAELLRQRYSQLYASWLLKAGDRVFDKIGLQTITKGLQRKKINLHSLKQEVYHLECDLPTEAIVLARFFGRDKVLRERKRSGMAAPSWGPALQSQESFSGFWLVLGKFFSSAAGTLQSLTITSYSSLMKLVYTSGIQRVSLRFMTGISTMYQKLAIKLNPHYRFGNVNPHLQEGFSVVVDRSKTLRSVTGERAYFSGTFHSGTIRFADSAQSFIRKHGQNKVVYPCNEKNMLGVSFTIDNLSGISSSGATANGFELVCGHIQGHVGAIPIESLQMHTNAGSQKAIPFFEKQGNTFLQSCSAPQLRLPEVVENQFDNFESGLSKFVDVIENDNSNKHSENPDRPFVVFSYESTETSCTPLGRRGDSGMATLAVGSVNCKLDLDTYGLLGLLSVVLLNTFNASEQPVVDKDSPSKESTSRSIIKKSDWEILYSNQLKRLLSTLVLKREVFLSIAVAGPTLEFSDLLLSSRSSKKGENVEALSKPFLLMDFGLFEATIWPAIRIQDELHPKSYDDGMDEPLDSTRKRKTWFVKLPSPSIQEGKVVEGRCQHEEIGNNGIVSLQGAYVSLLGVHHSKVDKLMRPWMSVWRFSFCRDHVISSSSVCTILSAAFQGSCSSMQVEIHFDEVDLLFEALNNIRTKTQAFCSMKKVHLEAAGYPLNEELRQRNLSFLGQGNFVALRQLLYHALSVKWTIDELGCTFNDKKIINGERRSGKKLGLSDSHEERSGSLDIPEQRDQFLVKTVWLNFSWGDGCPLLLSCGYDELSFIVIKALSESISNSGKSGNTSWKSKNAVMKPDEDNSFDVMKSQFLSEQFSFRIDQPWFRPHVGTSAGSDDLKFEHGGRTRQMSLDLQMEKFYVNYGDSTSLISKALSRLDEASGFAIHTTISDDKKKVSVMSKGGLIVLHTQALQIALEELRSLLSRRKVFSEIGTVDCNVSSDLEEPLKHESIVSPETMGRSLSLPIQHAQVKPLHKKRLLSAPLEPHVDDVQSASTAGWENRSWSAEDLCIEIASLYIVLAENRKTSSELAKQTSQGVLLLEMAGRLHAQTSMAKQLLSLEDTRFRCSAVFEEEKVEEITRKQTQVPQFGSSRKLHRKGSDEIHSGIDSNLVQDGKSATEFVHDVLKGDEKDLSKGLIVQRENDSILENMSISFELENGLGHFNRWSGFCNLLGLDIIITIPEAQFLLAIISSISSLPRSFVENEPKASKTLMEKPIKHATDDLFQIPDGSIVAVKDAREHLYIAVEKTQNSNYRLIGVLHYSLVGQRAFFKVKYQNNNKTSGRWFSLLSVVAKNADGEALRVHYRPGSGLADISSIHDGSWELWQTHPVQHTSKEGDGDIDLYRDLNRNMVHLVNQKSKQGLSLASGAPVMVKQPGSPFKLKVIQADMTVLPFSQLDMQKLNANTHEAEGHPSGSVASVPQVELKIGRIDFTLLHEQGGGKYLLPLLRGYTEDTEGVMHVQPLKMRLIANCKLAFEHWDAQVNQWSAIIQPIELEIFYRKNTSGERYSNRAKLPTSFFGRCKRVDICINEKSLDVLLFVIGILDLAGPYSIKYSPVLATSCLIENNTGLDLCCTFDSQENKDSVKIPAWRTDTFFIRNLISRRDLSRTKTLSSVSINLEKVGVGLSSPVSASLLKPSLTATRTRVEREKGHKRIAGPIVVMEVSKESQDGITVTISPMTRIRNCCGLSIELRCRRPHGDAEGVSVALKDGDIVDDVIGAFDALHLKGELKKALSSFGIGDYLLSIRPEGPLPTYLLGSVTDTKSEYQFDWSEDIKGVKPVHILGFFEKLEYGFRKSLKGQNMQQSFGTVFCSFKPDNKSSDPESSKGMHILLRFTSRRVPLRSTTPDETLDSTQPIVAWQEQKELVLLPTLCVHNFLDTKISVSKKSGAGRFPFNYHSSLESHRKASLFEDLTELVFAIEVDEFHLKSKDISMNEWSRSAELSSPSVDNVKELEKDLDFGDDNWCVKLKMFRATDGVLQVLVYSPYAVKNSTDTTLLVCMQRQSRFFGKLWRRGKVQWPSGETGTVLNSGTKMSLLQRSSYVLVQMAAKNSETAILDLESFSGSTELNIKTHLEDGLIEETPLGVRLEVTGSDSIDPTRTINIDSRYIVLNDSQEALFVCQDGLQDDENSLISLKAGDHVSLKTQFRAGQKQSNLGYSQFFGSDLVDKSACSIRFRFQKDDWEWTGPVCASAIGSFSARLHKRSDMVNAEDSVKTGDKERFKFISVEVQDEKPTLVIYARIQSADSVPYRIENALSQASIYFYQKGLNDVVTTLEPGESISYAWDDLSLSHKLIVGICGTQVHDEVKLDKLGPWKSFRAWRQKKVFGLQLPFDNQSDTNLPPEYTSGSSPAFDSMRIGYEIGADGSQRALRICEDVLSSKLTKWQSHVSFPTARMDFRVPVFGITLVELLKHNDVEYKEQPEQVCRVLPIISMRLSNIFSEILSTQKHLLFQLKVETLKVDERWEGAPFSAMLRVHSEDRFKKGETVLHMAAIISNQTLNPIHVKYSSILLQTIDVNLDEETLMKLVPFYRYSLAESGPSRQLYFERLEIHPIKIVASFIAGQPLADYNSMQEAFRTLLHSFIKVPSIRGSNVELNGVLLTHALMTFRQLAIKCAQHYSWYAMRAIYIVKGSKLLPPAFTSLFDDSAASSLDVFFDPSSGSVDFQGLTLGMFNFLSNGLKNRGFSGTSRYIGDLERTMKAAGSNILFAILTEVSDNVLKGAETGGLDGMVNGFRRGVLNVSMEPTLLRTAVVKGGSSRRIKLDHSPGTDEVYIEGYLQAMLDTLYQQNYLKVKVVDDQVFLKNLPPNSTLVDEIMASVKRFLVREGLLAAGETSGGETQSWRRLQGESDKRIIPAVAALSEQLFVIFAVRALRNRARSWFAKSTLNPFLKKEGTEKDENDGEGQHKGMKGILFSFVLSSAMAYIDGRLCRHIPNKLARRIVSGFLLSFVE